SPINPIFALVIIYLVSMRVRLLVDLANVLSRQRLSETSLSVYRLALRLYPDAVSRALALINYGAALLRSGQVDAATELLERALVEGGGSLPPKYEASCRYNLGVAYRRQGQRQQAIREFNRVMDLLPRSTYAIQAQKALERAAAKADERREN
ncbi:MAG TPA: tetratricopeptide repeat protein, partial [Anaerolineae bacterium]|nr:tetratricopeptide repeat protein [Anaerolineae bacterium]HIQ04798.1 tetratricopeptide repeat protein [Anaerolineae bacterium]